MYIFEGTESIITRSAPDKTNRQLSVSRPKQALQGLIGCLIDAYLQGGAQ